MVDHRPVALVQPVPVVAAVDLHPAPAVVAAVDLQPAPAVVVAHLQPAPVAVVVPLQPVPAVTALHKGQTILQGIVVGRGISAQRK